MTDPPVEIGRLLERPGATWTPDERDRFVEWLCAERVKWLLVVAAGSLRYYLKRDPLPQDVEDVVNEFLGVTMDAVARGFDPATASIFALIKTALVRFAKDVAEKARRRAPLGDPLVRPGRDGTWIDIDVVDEGLAGSPEHAVLTNERHVALWRCLHKLSRGFRAVVVLRLEGLSYEEIASELGLKPDTLKVRHSLALRLLRACLSQHLGEAAVPSAAPRPTRAEPAPAEIAFDTLIVGGGVMGLVALHALRDRGFSALLLERGTLGGEQTCHSHVYIHQGHLYQAVDLASRLKDTAPFWDAQNERGHIQRGFLPSLFGFTNEPEALDRTHLWSALGLPYDTVPRTEFPATLAAGAVRFVYQSPEVCFTGDSLMRTLQRGVVDEISRADTDPDFSVNANREIQHVEVVLPGATIRFRPHTLVLVAGAANQPMLDRLADLAGPLPKRAAQQIRQAHMLAIRGPRHVLAPLTGVFHLTRRLFIVSRVVGNEVVWLISDENSPTLPDVAPDAARDTEGWARGTIARWLRAGVIQALRELVPSDFVDPSPTLRVAVYAAPKAEGRSQVEGVPHEERVVQVLPNAWVVWPTKLTLAPLAARSVVEGIHGSIRKPCPWPTDAGGQVQLPKEWTRARAHVPVAKERWELIDRWDDWTGFNALYGPF